MGIGKLVIFPVVLGVLAYLLLVLPEKYFYTGFEKTPRPEGSAGPNPIPDKSKDGIHRENVKFDSNGTTCDGWLYIPEKGKSTTQNKKFYPCTMDLFILITKKSKQKKKCVCV